ncbi:DUF3494 domain-containing protein, partial [Bizionia saleffrena]
MCPGAIPIGANSNVKGTLFSHPGAISLGTGVTVEGRLLASEGAITIGAGSEANTPAGPITIPIKCLGLCAPNPVVDVLGSLKNYALFTSAGAVANAATSGIVGDIGSNAGAISGFATSTHVGSFYTPGEKTAQAVEDLDYAYNQLIDIPVTVSGHTPAFGSGETVNSGVYDIGAAGSLAGTITLDAQNNPDALFIFRFGGAFTVAAQSKVILTNGARRCNVFWIGGARVATGAVSIGTFTYMKGTVISHGGAATMGANGNLEGRLLSTAGAIGFSTGVIYNDTLCFVESEPVSGGNQEVCSDGTPSQTITATASNPSSTNQTMVWYDAPSGGTVVNTPSQVGIGSVTYYAESYNGAYSSETRAAVTLTIYDCSIEINAVVDSYTVVEVHNVATNVGVVTANDTLDDVTVTGANTNVTPISAGPLSIGAEGVLILEANTAPGTYSITYQLSEVGIRSPNFDTATATVLVTIIDAVIDTTAAVNGLTGGDTSSLGINDTLNGDPVVIGTGLDSVTLTGVTVPAGFTLYSDETGVTVPSGFTLNSDGTVTIPPNTPAGEYNVEYKICDVNNPANCDTVRSIIVVSAPVIDAVEDTTAAVNGLTGGDTTALTSNDTLNGNPLVIGTAPGNVSLTGVTVPSEFTLNGDGTVTIPPNTPAGEYGVEYKICEVNNPTNCDTVISTVVVLAPVIDAVVDTMSPVNGTTGGNTTAVTSNDTLNGDPVVIGTAPGNVSLTGVTVPSGFTLNTDGTVAIPPNTPAGNYNVEYQICEVNNSTNCDTANMSVNVVCEQIDTPTVSIDQPTCDTSTGTITVTAPTGTGLTYSINGSAYQIGNTFASLASGNYNVTVKNAADCISKASSVIIAKQPTTPVQPEISINTQTTCTTTTGSFTITNYEASYAYVVSPSTEVTISGDTVTAPAGTYTITSTLESCTSDASASVTITEQPGTPSEPTTECWETATFNNDKCSWEVTGTQQSEPTTECYETATFNDTICIWVVTGTQAAEPITECYETATFNNDTCIWEVTGDQATEPTTECYETATFNNDTCSWDVTGEQATEPTTECYETATFNDSTCSWVVTGEQAAAPNTECWETATFSNDTCSWVVTGTQLAAPITECWETATFNDSTCTWEVTGDQATEPTTECYETATFNNDTCSWVVTGEQSAVPATECWETATFNNDTCSWVVTGTQEAEPITECYETATFNNDTCSWDVTGEQAAAPATECWETATFNTESCTWEVTGDQATEPTTECYETATFN